MVARRHHWHWKLPQLNGVFVTKKSSKANRNKAFNGDGHLEGGGRQDRTIWPQRGGEVGGGKGVIQWDELGMTAEHSDSQTNNQREKNCSFYASKRGAKKKHHMNRLRIPTLWGDHVGRRRRMYRISAPVHSFSLFFFRHHCWGSDLMQTSAISPRIIRQTMTNPPESTVSESSGLWEADQKFEPLFYRQPELEERLSSCWSVRWFFCWVGSPVLQLSMSPVEQVQPWVCRFIKGKITLDIFFFFLEVSNSF